MSINWKNRPSELVITIDEKRRREMTILCMGFEEVTGNRLTYTPNCGMACEVCGTSRSPASFTGYGQIGIYKYCEDCVRDIIWKRSV